MISKRLQVRLRKIKKYLVSAGEPKPPVLNETQQWTIKNIRRFIVKKDAKMLIAPISGTRYIEYQHYFVKFNRNFATIRNGKLNFYVDLDYRAGDELIMFFNRIVEKQRQTLDVKYDTNTVHNLQKLYSNISNEPAKHIKKSKK